MSAERTSNCEIIERAVVLAPKVGVDPKQVICPFVDVCDGKSCFMIDGKGEMPVKVIDAKQRFFTRLQKTVANHNS